MQKPGIPKGTRDFGPEKMIKRNYIFENIRATFQKFGFMPLETPAMENLSVLTGKYGDEGDKLIFKILNSGDFLDGIKPEEITAGSKNLTPKISEKALRYDLTVPFARYVVMNRNEINFPFKRYQIQPVWRADRPQKGRYREFYQCDADVVGTNSLLCEAEIVLMINEAFEKLHLKEFIIKINNRKLLTGITEIAGKKGSEGDLCVAIDKLDKIGKDGVIEELKTKGFSEEAVKKLSPVFDLQGSNEEKIKFFKTEFEKNNIESGLKGIEEVEKIFKHLKDFNSAFDPANLEFDISLARGLSYYTGAIFEVKAKGISIGSICGGGRYDNLTGVFGLPNVSGVGISFGVDRIYDVMEELNIFPKENLKSTKVLVCYFDETTEKFSLPLLTKLRQAGINSEAFPEQSKGKKPLEKPLNYAENKLIPFAIIVKPEDIETGLITLKNTLNGEQVRLTIEEIIEKIK